jgi:hypothetical protein
VTSESSEDPADRADDIDFADENPLNRFLERNLFPRIVRYTIHPLHILVLLLLWIGLLFWHNTIFELVGGNYTNGLSAMAASIVLLQQTRQHREAKRLHRESRILLEELKKLMHPHATGGRAVIGRKLRSGRRPRRGG